MRAEILRGDCAKILADQAADSVDLIFADPPFNIGFKYDVYNDLRSKRAYLAWAWDWLRLFRRIIKPTGSIFIAIGDEYAAEYKLMLESFGFTMRNWIVWNYNFGPHQKRKFGRDNAHILYFVADPNRFTFNADAIRVESERQRMGDKRANPAGRVPGDVWRFARLPGNAKERTGHPCQMPEAVLERIIRAASNPGDLILDPFAGSGTTLAVAKRLGRQFIGIELSPDYAIAIESRLAKVASPVSEDDHAC